MLIGRSIIAVVNLAPRKMMGIESAGMLLAAKATDGLTVLALCPGAPAGAKLG